MCVFVVQCASFDSTGYIAMVANELRYGLLASRHDAVHNKADIGKTETRWLRAQESWYKLLYTRLA